MISLLLIPRSFFFNANVSSGLRAQIIICLSALLLRAADEIFLWLLFYMLSKKLANCVFVPM